MPLDPLAKQILEFLETAMPRDPAALTPESLRAGYRALIAGRRGPEVARVEDRRLPGPAGEIPVRLYQPEPDRTRGLLVYFHGGGFVACGLDTHDGTCRLLARDAGCAVLSVDYRLAPEARFPAAPEDCYAATRWAVANARSLGADPSCVAVGGDSAGGNLAAVVAQQVRDRGGPRLAHQLLVYPVTEIGADTPSRKENARGYFLTDEMMHWFERQYLARPDDRLDPLASPQLARDLAGLAPATVITAEFDPLRDEGEAYAERLRRAGVPVELRRYDGLFHGFFSMAEVLDPARQALEFASARLRDAFAG
jgi:acetyl esterase